MAKGQKKSDQLVKQGAGVPAPIIDAAHQPLGVSPTYTAPQGAKPRYFSGAQREIAATLGREDRGDLQYRLKALGLIPSSTKLMLGVWDDASANAFTEVLKWANATGTDWKGALDDMESAALAAPPEVATQSRAATNPLDFKALGNSTALDSLGVGLTDQQQSSFAADAAAQEAPYLNSDATTSEPSSAGWQEWAKTKVRNFDPTNFDAHKVLAGVDVLSQMLGGQR